FSLNGAATTLDDWLIHAPNAANADQNLDGSWSRSRVVTQYTYNALTGKLEAQGAAGDGVSSDGFNNYTQERTMQVYSLHTAQGVTTMRLDSVLTLSWGSLAIAAGDGFVFSWSDSTGKFSYRLNGAAAVLSAAQIASLSSDGAPLLFSDE